MERLMTVEQVAERLQVNEQTVRRWLRQEEMTGVPFGGRTGWRISEDDLKTFIERKRFGGEPEKEQRPRDPATRAAFPAQAPTPVSAGKKTDQ
jgi:excisionase family DNA binding protein